VSGFLDRMAASSRERLDEARAREPLATLRIRALATPPAPALIVPGSFNLIAEFKRRSPSFGRLGDADLIGRATAYANAGAAAVSVLTEPSQFHGNLDHLTTAAKTLAPFGVPAMRKDFLVDPYQLYETRAAGAGGTLLIVRMLSQESLSEMMDCARELGLFVLLEAFDTDDIARATRAVEVAGSPRASDLSSAERASGEPGRIPTARVVVPAILLGVNCRDLQTLEVMPGRFAELAEKLPQNASWVAESGIATPDDCAEIVRDGYDMALIGSALMTAPDPSGVIKTMLAAGRAAA
jgi:indole-3-glycerol phosphate synthase